MNILNRPTAAAQRAAARIVRRCSACIARAVRMSEPTSPLRGICDSILTGGFVRALLGRALTAAALFLTVAAANLALHNNASAQSPTCTGNQVTVSIRGVGSDINEIYSFSDPEDKCIDPAYAVMAEKCTEAGWSASTSTCIIPHSPPGIDRVYIECGFAGTAANGGPACIEAFGEGITVAESGVTFPENPSPSVAAVFGTPPVGLELWGTGYVYNCDPAENKGVVPAKHNTEGQTECSCSAATDQNGILYDEAEGVCTCPMIEVNNRMVEQFILQDGGCGYCPAGQIAKNNLCVEGVCDAEQVVARSGKCVDRETKCTGEGWTANGGQCMIPSRDETGNADHEKCFYTDSTNDIPPPPKCQDIFGDNLDFPTKPGVGEPPRYVYNCGSGFSPEDVNLDGATSCSQVKPNPPRVEKRADNAVIINWSRPAEAGRRDPDYYTLLRSEDGVTFMTLSGAASLTMVADGHVDADFELTEGETLTLYYKVMALQESDASAPVVIEHLNCEELGLIPGTGALARRGACAAGCLPGYARPGGAETGECLLNVVDNLLVALNAENHFVTLTWDAAVDEGDAPRYEVHRSENEEAFAAAATVARRLYVDSDGSVAGGTTVRYKVRLENLTGEPLSLSAESAAVVVPQISAEACEQELRLGDGLRGTCGDCDADAAYDLPTISTLTLPDVCIKQATEDADDAEFANDEDVLCRAFGGVVLEADGNEVCSGVDAAGTFCIVDAADLGNAFACRGLFKHVRQCNFEFNRPALNPFLCGPRCADGGKVIGMHTENCAGP